MTWTTPRHFGRVDIVVNNAATNPAFGPLIDVDLVEVDGKRLAPGRDVLVDGGVLVRGAAITGSGGQGGQIRQNFQDAAEATRAQSPSP